MFIEASNMGKKFNTAAQSISLDVLTLKNENNQKLLKTLYNQKDKVQFCDVQFIINNEILPVHACVLASFSSYLADILESCNFKKDNSFLLHWCKQAPLNLDLNVIFDSSDNTCFECFKKIIDFMYLGHISINNVHLSHLEMFVKKLKISELILFCSQYRFKFSRELKVKNCIENQPKSVLVSPNKEINSLIGKIIKFSDTKNKLTAIDKESKTTTYLGSNENNHIDVAGVAPGNVSKTDQNNDECVVNDFEFCESTVSSLKNISDIHNDLEKQELNKTNIKRNNFHIVSPIPMKIMKFDDKNSPDETSTQLSTETAQYKNDATTENGKFVHNSLNSNNYDTIGTSQNVRENKSDLQDTESGINKNQTDCASEEKDKILDVEKTTELNTTQIMFEKNAIINNTEQPMSKLFTTPTTSQNIIKDNRNLDHMYYKCIDTLQCTNTVYQPQLINYDNEDIDIKECENNPLDIEENSTEIGQELIECQYNIVDDNFNLNNELSEFLIPKEQIKSDRVDEEMKDMHKKEQFIKLNESGVLNKKAVCNSSNISLNDSSNNYRCLFCNFQTGLMQHFIFHLVDTNHEYIKCLICNYKEKDNGLLKDHILEHLGSEPINCSVCDKKYETRQTYKKHWHYHFSKVYFCEICNRKFKRKVNLNKHVLVMHSKFKRDKSSKMYVCPETNCGFKTFREYDLSKHKRSHEAGTDVQCEICKMFFSQRKNLIRHEQMMHSVNTNLKCVFCKFETTRKDKIQIHYSEKHNIMKSTQFAIKSASDEEIKNLFEIVAERNEGKQNSASQTSYKIETTDLFEMSGNHNENESNPSNTVLPQINFINQNENTDIAENNSQLYTMSCDTPELVQNQLVTTQTVSDEQVLNDLTEPHCNTEKKKTKRKRKNLYCNKNSNQHLLSSDGIKNIKRQKSSKMLRSFMNRDSVFNHSNRLNEPLYFLNEATEELISLSLKTYNFHENFKSKNKKLKKKKNLNFNKIISIPNKMVSQKKCLVKKRAKKNTTKHKWKEEVVTPEQLNNRSNPVTNIYGDNSNLQNAMYAENTIEESKSTHHNNCNNTNNNDNLCLLNNIVENVTFNNHMSKRFGDESLINHNSDPVMNWHEFNNSTLSLGTNRVYYVSLTNKDLSPDEYILNEQTGNITFLAPFLNEGTGELSTVNMTIDPMQFINMGNIENVENNADTLSIASDDNTLDDINFEQIPVSSSVFKVPHIPSEFVSEENRDNSDNFLNELTGELCKQYLNNNLCTQNFTDQPKHDKNSVLDEVTGELLENQTRTDHGELFKLTNVTDSKESINSSQQDVNNSNNMYPRNDWFFDSFQDDSLDFSLEKRMFPGDININVS